MEREGDGQQGSHWPDHKTQTLSVYPVLLSFSFQTRRLRSAFATAPI